MKIIEGEEVGVGGELEETEREEVREDRRGIKGEGVAEVVEEHIKPMTPNRILRLQESLKYPRSSTITLTMSQNIRKKRISRADQEQQRGVLNLCVLILNSRII